MTAVEERDQAVDDLVSLTLANDELTRERDLAEARIVSIQDELDTEKATLETYMGDLQSCRTEKRKWKNGLDTVYTNIAYEDDPVTYVTEIYNAILNDNVELTDDD